jgi:hypothetical protein
MHQRNTTALKITWIMVQNVFPLLVNVVAIFAQLISFKKFVWLVLNSQQRQEIFIFLTVSNPAPYTMGSFPGQGHESDHYPPSSVEVKNDGAILPFLYTSSWPGPQLIKHMNLPFTVSN